MRAWTVRKGATAPQAAGVIHTDFEHGFIRAEVIAYDDFIAYKGEAGAKEAGKLRLEGKEYVVREGDVMHFQVQRLKLRLFSKAKRSLSTRRRREKQRRPPDRMKNRIRAHLSGLADLVVSQVGTNDFEQAIRGRTRRKEANVLAVSAH